MSASASALAQAARLLGSEELAQALELAEADEREEAFLLLERCRAALLLGVETALVAVREAREGEPPRCTCPDGGGAVNAHEPACPRLAWEAARRPSAAQPEKPGQGW